MAEQRVFRSFFCFFVVVASGGCGLLNGLTDGDLRSPFAGGEGEGEGDVGVEGEGDVVCAGPGCGVACQSDDDCDGLVCEVVCRPCFNNDECGDGGVCTEGVCDDATGPDGEGEGEGEGEGADPVVADPSVAGTEECVAQRVTLQTSSSSVQAEVRLAEGFEPGGHAVVLVPDAASDAASWQTSPRNLTCSLVLRNVAVIAIEPDTAAGPEGAISLAVRAATDVLAVDPGNVGIAAAHKFLVDSGGGLERVAYVSGVADSPDPGAIAESVGVYPARFLVMGAANDSDQTGTSTADYARDVGVAVLPSLQNASFVVVEGSDHGVALAGSSNLITAVTGSADFGGAGDIARTAFLNFFDPDLGP